MKKASAMDRRKECNGKFTITTLHCSSVVFALLRLGLHCSSQKNEEQAN
jgi:hypothetical protein